MGTKEKSGELFYMREMIFLAERQTIGEYNSREGTKYFEEKAEALPFSRLQMCHPVREGELAPPQRLDIRKSEDELEAELEFYLKYLEKYETRLKDCLHREAMGKNYIKGETLRAKPSEEKPREEGRQFRNDGNREENQFAYPSTEKYHRECHLCGELHKFGSLKFCKDFLAKSHDEKMSIVNRGKFCISCLQKVSHTRDRP